MNDFLPPFCQRPSLNKGRTFFLYGQADDLQKNSVLSMWTATLTAPVRTFFAAHLPLKGSGGPGGPISLPPEVLGKQRKKKLIFQLLSGGRHSAGCPCRSFPSGKKNRRS